MKTPTRQTSSKTRSILEHWRSNDAAFIQDCLHTQTKDAQIVPMRFDQFPAQRRFVELVQKSREAKLPCRIVALKARQVGQTTISSALIFARTVLAKNIQSKIISHDIESVRGILAKCNLFYQMMPEDFRPMLARSSRTEMSFENPSKKDPDRPGLRSRISIESAAKATIGRSFTVMNALGSEVAFWKDGDTGALAILNAVPRKPNTCVIFESTANGMGGFFYDKYQEAKDPKSIWEPFFFAWFEQPEYRYAPDDTYNAEDLTSEEQQLQVAFGLDDQQIAWRRFAIENQCGGDVELFRQEFPSNDEEAFLVSGRPAFDRSRCQYQQSRYCSPGQRLVLHSSEPSALNAGTGGVRAEPVRSSAIEIWERPETGRTYIAFADCAQGVEDGDYQCCTILDVITLEQVAIFHANCDPDYYADEIVKMATWYNNAMLAIEKNGSGGHVLARVSWQYGNLYCDEKWDDGAGQPTTTYGWWMDDTKKRMIMHELNSGIRMNRIKIRSSETIDEMLIYQRDEKGRFNAPKGQHDDRVVALAGAYWIARSQELRSHASIQGIWSDVQFRQPLQQRLAHYAAFDAMSEDEDLPYWAT